MPRTHLYESVLPLHLRLASFGVESAAFRPPKPPNFHWSEEKATWSALSTVASLPVEVEDEPEEEDELDEEELLEDVELVEVEELVLEDELVSDEELAEELSDETDAVVLVASCRLTQAPSSSYPQPAERTNAPAASREAKIEGAEDEGRVMGVSCRFSGMKAESRPPGQLPFPLPRCFSAAVFRFGYPSDALVFPFPMQTQPSARLRALESGGIFRLLVGYSWPALVSTTLNMLYNVVDRVYIGQGCGADAIAALALTFPIMMVVGAVGPLIGGGSATTLSIQLGEKDHDGAERTLGQMFALKILFGLVAPFVLYFVVLDPALAVMGADRMNAETVALARRYLAIVLPFMMTQHLAFGLSGAMRAEGAPVRSMRCMVLGCLANFVLDPVFIFGFDMGVAGAAWATNIAMLLSLADALYYYFGGSSAVRVRFRRIRIYSDLLPRVLAIGLAPFLMMLAMSLVNFAFNRAFATWSATPVLATTCIASFGILHAVAGVFFTPAMGIQQGLGPIVGYNWGAKNFSRVRRAAKTGLCVTLAFTTAACLLQVIFAEPLAWCFARSDPELIAHGARAIRVGNCCVWCIGLNVSASTYFQSVGRPRTAILLSLLRQVICLIPCAFLLPYLFPADPIRGVWLAMPISDLVACVATVFPWMREMRSLRDLEATAALGTKALPAA